MKQWNSKQPTDVGGVTSSNGCSVRCGEGVQSAMYICEEFVVPAEQKDKTKGLWRAAQLGERACMRAGLGPTPTQPATVRCQGTCEPVYWMTSNWSEELNGLRRMLPLVKMNATRRYFSEHDFYRPVAEYLCSAMPRPPPVVRRCADYCGVRWSAKPITSTSTDVGGVTSSNGCSVRCGEGVQSAMYICEEFVVPAEQKDKTKGLWRAAQLGERACMRAGLGPTPTQPATVRCQGTCEPVYWMTSNWSECSSNCAIGERHRYLHCQQSNGREWQLQECFSQGDLTHTGDPTPSGSISHQEAVQILFKHVEQGQLNTNVGKQLGYQQSESCISLSGCHNQIQWIATPWSECQLMTDSMRVLCRSVDYNDAYTKPASAHLIAMRTRQVYCQLNLPTVHSSLGQYMEVTDEATATATSVRPPWRMKMEFCRKATHLLPGFPTEPVNRESCERPFCYRWGQAKISECSTTCGPGFKTATVPCERVTLDLRSISTTSLDPQNHHQQRFSPPAHWVEQVSLNECHSQLGYSPRIFLSADNQSLHVETIERPFDEQQGTELKGISLDKLIQVNCFNKPCITSIVVWHTSSWSQCSVTCGIGVRRRQVLCMLETHGRSLSGTYQSHADNHISSGSRLSAELTDSQRCLDASLPKPTDQEPCDGCPCPQWLPEAWSQCEGTCEFGIQHRQVRCVLDNSLSKSTEAHSSTSDNDRAHALLFPSTQSRQRARRNRATQLMEVEPERCQGVGTIPITKRICLLPGGCPFWHKGEWSSCSSNCAIGERHRYLHCQQSNGREWQLQECFSQGDLTHTGDPTPSGSISHQEAVQILFKHVEQGQLNTNVGKQLGYQQSESCISLSGCHNQIQWIATPWSECQLMTDSMRVLCRSVDYNDAYTKPASAHLIAMRTRQVYCQLNLPTVHSSLGQYMEVTDEATATATSVRPPWRMKMEFCRKATHLLPGFPTEPVNRESCERPFCYRWGQAKISEVLKHLETV
ncbi:hypothetical protein AHF37_09360 [Paragonimus kellicotti]|nr:hypothetical protein AHF37_09360 [Paragonimus kellicotti]